MTLINSMAHNNFEKMVVAQTEMSAIEFFFFLFLEEIIS